MKPELFEGEEIKDVKGYEEVYAITNFGRVWSYPKGNSNNTNGKWLKPDKRAGYLYVNLCKNNQKCDKLIHRLVAQAFIPNPNNYPTVDHIDKNKLNNNVSNLRWATMSVQIKNQDRSSEKWKEAHKISIKKATEAHKRKVRCIETNAIYESQTEASKQTRIDRCSISLVCLGKQKTAGGYHWEFVKEKQNEIN